MKLQHFAISRTDSESLSDFITKIAGEVAKTEEAGKIIKDIVLTVKDEPEEKASVVVIYDYEPHSVAPKKDTWDVDSETFYAEDADSSLSALLNATAKLEKWSETRRIDAYDMTTSLRVGDKGQDIARIDVYYSQKQ